MNTAKAKSVDIVSELKDHGLRFVCALSGGWLKLNGMLEANGEAHECEILVDPKLFELPVIRLLKLPLGLPTLVPHIGQAGILCYLAKGSVVPDIFDPVGQILACIERAQRVLSMVLSGRMVEDLEEEFFSYWHGPSFLLDLQNQQLGRQQAFLTKCDEPVLGVVTDDPIRSAAKLKSIGWDATKQPFTAYRVKTNAKPRPDQKTWPPQTVQQLLAWQCKLDTRCRKKIQERLWEAFSSKKSHAIILIESPLLTYGFLAIFDPPKDIRQQVPLTRKRMYAQEIMRLSLIRIDDRYLTERNLPGGHTLAGLNLCLVGCGTIGGYLADMLVKGGAGTSGGRLVLIDPEILGPQNLGRHRLGFPNLFKNKAQELKLELQRSSPGAEIAALPVDVRTANLGNPDLLIDATGEEALGHWLASRAAKVTPLLSVWIEGAGLAVRGLLKSRPDGACHRCLSDANRSGEFWVFDEPTPVVMRGQGCEGLYVPFPASASVQAASLAAEMVQDWINGDTGHALRTRTLNQRRKLATPDCNPPQRENCPACGS